MHDFIRLKPKFPGKSHCKACFAGSWRTIEQNIDTLPFPPRRNQPLEQRAVFTERYRIKIPWQHIFTLGFSVKTSVQWLIVLPVKVILNTTPQIKIFIKKIKHPQARLLFHQLAHLRNRMIDAHGKKVQFFCFVAPMKPAIERIIAEHRIFSYESILQSVHFKV